MFEPMITNSWLAARTERLRVGSLVLCDSFRHPAVLARESVTVDHASGGRFELGIGWGSVPTELEVFGIGSTDPAARIGRMRESLEIIEALWRGDPSTTRVSTSSCTVPSKNPYRSGRSRSSSEARAERPWSWSRPMRTGGTSTSGYSTGSTTCDPSPVRRAARSNCRSQLVPSEGQRAQIADLALRRFGRAPVVGTTPELVDHFGSLVERRVERVYVWFCDFAPPETLTAFGEEVIRHFGD